VVRPWEEQRLLEYGLGITNLVARATARAAELGPDELRAGRARLEWKVRRFRPRAVAVLGIGAYRLAFKSPRAAFGRQRTVAGQPELWVLPNPSGLNANHQLPDLARAFGELREVVGNLPAG
jgi:TDG/mug DNA glycosylase family protein